MSKSAARKIEKSADAYRSIGEASEELGLQPHVLRYWETKFTKFVKPLKRRDGRRMFRPDDLAALRAIQMLVHDKGMTLKGAGKLLREQGVPFILATGYGGNEVADEGFGNAPVVKKPYSTSTIRAAFARL